MAKSLKDSKDLLMHLVHGAALPEHLSKPRSDGLDRKVLAAKAEEQLKREPLVAICLSHKCRCGNSWASFGFYARKTLLEVPGQGRAAVTKRLDYTPHDERVTETIWQPVEEAACMNCYGGVSLLIAAGAAHA